MQEIKNFRRRFLRFGQLVDEITEITRRGEPLQIPPHGLKQVHELHLRHLMKVPASAALVKKDLIERKGSTVLP